MNPGVGQEAGETARGFITAMKEQPALLALIVANFAMIIFVFYLFNSNNKAWEQVNNYRIEVGKEVFRYVTETTRLLAQCSTISPDQIPKNPSLP
jgi:hypothetical protein